MREKLSLNGVWKFCPAFVELEGNQRFMKPNFDPDAPEAEAGSDGAWTAPGYDDAGWMDILVPASWNTAIEDLWSYEGHGWYRTEVRIPETWRRRRVVFASEGANHMAVVYVNGKKAGEHEGAFTPFSIPVHELLEYGAQNTIAVSVDNIPKRERCPGGQFDWWNHGGLYRPVWLEVMDPVHFDEVIVNTEPGDRHSHVAVRAVVVAGGSDAGALEMRATLFDAGGTSVAGARAPVMFVGERGEASLTLQVRNALLWSPDEPNLYKLVVELRDPDTGACRDTYQCRIGIRSVVLDGGRLFVNGKPFMVKGFNRYEDYPGSGRTPDEAACRRDLAMIKDMGGNTIRCHCPNSPQTYDICDEIGMFFVSELPLNQWGRPLVETDSPEALATGKAQLRELIKWQRNHPCVLMWSVSNENLCKPLQDTERYRELADMVVQGNIELVEMCHELDPARAAIEVSNCWPGDRVFDKTSICAVNMYIGTRTPHVSTLHELAEVMHTRLDALRAEQPGKPILICELGAWCVRGFKTDYFPGETYQAELIKTYWNALENEENVIGGIIWCFADSDTHRRFEWVYEYRCAYGVVDFHRRPKEAVSTIRELWRRNSRG